MTARLTLTLLPPPPLVFQLISGERVGLLRASKDTEMIDCMDGGDAVTECSNEFTYGSRAS